MNKTITYPESNKLGYPNLLNASQTNYAAYYLGEGYTSLCANLPAGTSVKVVITPSMYIDTISSQYEIVKIDTFLVDSTNYRIDTTFSDKLIYNTEIVQSQVYVTTSDINGWDTKLIDDKKLIREFTNSISGEEISINTTLYRTGGSAKFDVYENENVVPSFSKVIYWNSKTR